MIEAFMILLVGSILIVVLNKMPEKGVKVEKHKKLIDKFFESFHVASDRKLDKQSDTVVADLEEGELKEKDKEVVEEAEIVEDDVPEPLSERDVLLNEADAFLKEDKLKEAEEKYIEVLKIDEHDTQSYKGLGNICFKKEDYKNAHDIFDKLTKIVPKDSSNYCNLGMCCYKEKDFDRARDNYLKALKIEKKPVYYKNLGITLLKLKKSEEAADAFIRSLEKNSKDKESFSVLLSLLDEFSGKKFKKILLFLQKIDPKNSLLKKYSDKK